MHKHLYTKAKFKKASDCYICIQKTHKIMIFNLTKNSSMSVSVERVADNVLIME